MSLQYGLFSSLGSSLLVPLARDCVNILGYRHGAVDLVVFYDYRFGETFDMQVSATRDWAGHMRVIGSYSPNPSLFMEAFFVSVLTITVGEIGDKTQLLALLLAARFKRPIPIILGILVATLLNHALAGAVGGWVRTAIDPDVLRWILGASFLLIAAWALVPDEVDDQLKARGGYGVFAITCVTFFLAEMGDKTQIATIALAVKYTDFFQVVAGTTLGMMIADVPAVILGKVASPNFPFRAVRLVSAAIFAFLGIVVLAGFQF